MLSLNDRTEATLPDGLTDYRAQPGPLAPVAMKSMSALYYTAKAALSRVALLVRAALQCTCRTKRHRHVGIARINQRYGII